MNVLSAGVPRRQHCCWDHLPRRTPNYTDGEIYAEFKRTDDEVRSTGYSMKHWRAPRGEQSNRLAAIITEGSRPLYSLSHCDWHADSGDSAGGASAPAQMVTNIKAGLKSMAGVRLPDGRRTYRLLFHVKPTTARALPAVLSDLAADGHQFIDFQQDS